MQIKELLKNVKYLKIVNYKDVEIKNISMDSRFPMENGLFICIKGNNTDGHTLISEAISNGAVAFICEKELHTDKMQIIVEDSRIAMSYISATFYRLCENRPKMIGVVGTNGKTTTTYMLKSILETAGKKVGIIGTLGIYYGNVSISPELTTPDSIYLHSVIANMVNCGVEYILMEVSAHAIYYKKVESIFFDVLIFTNCTHDHLDFFKNFEEYKNTKISIFNKNKCGCAIVNSDDKIGREIINNYDGNLYTYGITCPADVFAVNEVSGNKSTEYIINLFDAIYNVKLNIGGEYNVYNSLAASATAGYFKIKPNTVVKGLDNLKKIEGRMEFVENINGADVFVDFAHTPDGLERTLKTLKKNTKNRLICLFGCGGNRDKEKRAEMGKIAGQNADFTIITSDNPRFEEPYSIISEIENGIRKITLSYITIQNRYLATCYAIQSLKEGDVLAVLGKGAENYQEIMGVKQLYSDVKSIKKIIAEINTHGEFI